MLDNLDREIEVGQTVFAALSYNDYAYSVVGVVREIFTDTEQVKVQSLAPGMFGGHPTKTFNPRQLVVIDSKTLDKLMLMKLTY
ncbi:hypothetical protein D3C87_588250 [compost metagenome]